MTFNYDVYRQFLQLPRNPECPQQTNNKYHELNIFKEYAQVELEERQNQMATHKQLNEKRRRLRHFVEQFVPSVVSDSNMSAVDLTAVTCRGQEILIAQF